MLNINHIYMTYTSMYIYLAMVFHFSNRKRYKYETHTHTNLNFVCIYYTINTYVHFKKRKKAWMQPAHGSFYSLSAVISPPPCVCRS